VRHGAQLRAQARQRCRREGGAEIDRQLAAGGRFDASEHVGGAAPGEIASHEFGGNRNSRARKFVGGSRRGDLFAVDQHAVAIKDDHGSLTPACLRRRIGFVLFNESRPKRLGIVRTWQKSGAERPGEFFTQFLRFARKNGDDRASWPKGAGKKTSLVCP
jgi:hypothetical protein